MIQKILRLISAIVICFMLQGCQHQEEEDASGLGTYHCYYQNVQTGKFFQGDSDKEYRAKRAAYDLCKPTSDRNRSDCQFCECLFRAL